MTNDFRSEIYVARPFKGFDIQEVRSYLVSIGKELAHYGYRMLYSLAGKDDLDGTLLSHGYDHPIARDHAVFERDRWMATKADIVLVDLSMAGEVSIGCVMELAWAAQAGRHTIVVMTKDNPHWHAFVLEAADVVFETLDEALNYLEALGRDFREQ